MENYQPNQPSWSLWALNKLTHLAVVFNSAGSVVACNQAFCQAVGQTESAVLGKTLQQLHLPLETVKTWHALVTAVVQSDEEIAVYTKGLRDFSNTYETVAAPLPSPPDEPSVVVLSHRVLAQPGLQPIHRAILHATRDAILVINLQGAIISANQAVYSIYGYTPDEITKLSLYDLRPGITHETLESQMSQTAAHGLLYEAVHRRKDGQLIQVEVSAQGATLDDQQVYVAAVRDVSGREAAQHELLELRTLDSLTGLHNYFYYRQQLDRMDREGIRPVGIIALDINGLKLINDTKGQEAGDNLLVAVADSLHQRFGRSGIVSRIGSAEFGVLLPQAEEAELSKACLEIKEFWMQQGVSVAVGAAAATLPTENIHSIKQKAEERMRFNKLSQSGSILSSILLPLMRSLYEKSNETEAHTNRLRKYAALVGPQMGLSDYEFTELDLLAALHDIGKIGISEAIINKAGPLDPEEWLEMRQHSEIGYRIAKTVSALAPIAESILTHHERWDGQGYPLGLSQQAIPVLARIISVIDAFDVMVSGRSYRPAISVQAACDELLACVGTHFDPSVVKIFINAINQLELI